MKAEILSFMRGVKKLLLRLQLILIGIRIWFHKSKTCTLHTKRARQILARAHERKPYETGNEPESIPVETDVELSLVVPVYNAEKYLRDCLDSLLTQETQYNYEVICVDDGSADTSPRILADYQGRYANVKVIHQANGGISAARNAGLTAASGRYVGFVDNDDTVTSNYVQTLLEAAYTYDADYVKAGYQIDNIKTGSCRKVSRPFAVIKDNKDNILDYDGFIWGGAKKRAYGMVLASL